MNLFALFILEAQLEDFAHEKHVIFADVVGFHELVEVLGELRSNHGSFGNNHGRVAWLLGRVTGGRNGAGWFDGHDDTDRYD